MYSRISSSEFAWPSPTQAIADKICPGVQVAALVGVLVEEGLLHRVQRLFLPG